MQLVLKHRGKYQIGYAAIRSIATNLAFTALESMRMWVPPGPDRLLASRGAMRSLREPRCKSFGRPNSQGGGADNARLELSRQGITVGVFTLRLPSTRPAQPHDRQLLATHASRKPTTTQPLPGRQNITARARVIVYTGAVPVFTAIRPAREEPSSIPAASPRLPRCTSPWLLGAHPSARLGVHSKRVCARFWPYLPDLSR